MSSVPSVSIREVYPSTCEKLLDLREQIKEQVLREAKKSQNVSYTSLQASEKAKELVSTGFSHLEWEVHLLYQSPPWSDIASMFLKTSKKQFFFCTLGLLGRVEKIITGKTIEESKETDEWVF